MNLFLFLLLKYLPTWVPVKFSHCSDMNFSKAGVVFEGIFQTVVILIYCGWVTNELALFQPQTRQILYVCIAHALFADSTLTVERKGVNWEKLQNNFKEVNLNVCCRPKIAVILFLLSSIEVRMNYPRCFCKSIKKTIIINKKKWRYFLSLKMQTPINIIQLVRFTVQRNLIE